MKTKNNILIRASALGDSTGPVSARDDAYQFGANLEILSGAVTVTLIVEQTSDSGATWVPVVTFTLDTNNSPISTPDLAFDGTTVRARISAVSGTGQFYLSAWMK